MPLPDYGHFNMEKKTHQDLVFEMAPEIVSDDECDVINGKRVHRKRGKVTTGKIGIDLERKLIINEAEDPSVWRTVVDQKDIEDARKYSAPERKVLKADVRKTLDSLISGSKLNSIKNVRRPSVTDAPPPSADYNKSVRFSLPKDNRQSEESVTGVSIQPSGTYRLGTVCTTFEYEHKCQGTTESSKKQKLFLMSWCPDRRRVLHIPGQQQKSRSRAKYPTERGGGGVNRSPQVEEEVVLCYYGRGEADRLMIQCKLCLNWQHGICLAIFTTD